MTFSEWLAVSGLALDIAGAGLVLWPLLRITERDALEQGLPRYAAETDEENLRHSGVRAILREVRFARSGLVLLIIGFSFQVVAVIRG